MGKIYNADSDDEYLNDYYERRENADDETVDGKVSERGLDKRTTIEDALCYRKHLKRTDKPDEIREIDKLNNLNDR